MLVSFLIVTLFFLSNQLNVDVVRESIEHIGIHGYSPSICEEMPGYTKEMCESLIEQEDEIMLQTGKDIIALSKICTNPYDENNICDLTSIEGNGGGVLEFMFDHRICNKVCEGEKECHRVQVSTCHDRDGFLIENCDMYMMEPYSYNTTNGDVYNFLTTSMGLFKEVCVYPEALNEDCHDSCGVMIYNGQQYPKYGGCSRFYATFGSGNYLEGIPSESFESLYTRHIECQDTKKCEDVITSFCSGEFVQIHPVVTDTCPDTKDCILIPGLGICNPDDDDCYMINEVPHQQDCVTIDTSDLNCPEGEEYIGLMVDDCEDLKHAFDDYDYKGKKHWNDDEDDKDDENAKMLKYKDLECEMLNEDLSFLKMCSPDVRDRCPYECEAEVGLEKANLPSGECIQPTLVELVLNANPDPYGEPDNFLYLLKNHYRPYCQCFWGYYGKFCSEYDCWHSHKDETKTCQGKNSKYHVRDEDDDGDDKKWAKYTTHVYKNNECIFPNFCHCGEEYYESSQSILYEVPEDIKYGIYSMKDLGYDCTNEIGLRIPGAVVHKNYDKDDNDDNSRLVNCGTNGFRVNKKKCFCYEGWVGKRCEINCDVFGENKPLECAGTHIEAPTYQCWYMKENCCAIKRKFMETVTIDYGFDSRRSIDKNHVHITKKGKKHFTYLKNPFYMLNDDYTSPIFGYPYKGVDITYCCYHSGKAMPVENGVEPSLYPEDCCLVEKEFMNTYGEESVMECCLDDYIEDFYGDWCCDNVLTHIIKDGVTEDTCCDGENLLKVEQTVEIILGGDDIKSTFNCCTNMVGIDKNNVPCCYTKEIDKMNICCLPYENSPTNGRGYLANINSEYNCCLGEDACCIIHGTNSVGGDCCVEDSKSYNKCCEDWMTADCCIGEIGCPL